MVKYIKNKQTGKFAGSIGVGKNKTPQPKPLTREEHLTLIALIDPQALSQNPNIRREAAQVKPINRIVAQHLMKDPFPDLLTDLVRNPTLDLDLLIKISKYRDSFLRQTAISTGRLPIQHLTKLARTSNKDTLFTITKYTTDPHLLDKLSKNAPSYLQKNITRNLSTSPETLAKIASKAEGNIRAIIAAHPNTGIETLETLSTDKYNYVKFQVAINPNTPINTVKSIFSSQNIDNKIDLIQTRKLPKTFIEELATTNSDPQIRKEAKWSTI